MFDVALGSTCTRTGLNTGGRSWVRTFAASEEPNALCPNVVQVDGDTDFRKSQHLALHIYNNDFVSTASHSTFSGLSVACISSPGTSSPGTPQTWPCAAERRAASTQRCGNCSGTSERGSECERMRQVRVGD
jgi:hypothetical protein